METYYIQEIPGRTENVRADRIEDDATTGLRRFLRRGEVVRAVPIDTPTRVITVTEDLRPRRGWRA